MKIDRINIFSTQLDSEYNNVLDLIDGGTQFFEHNVRTKYFNSLLSIYNQNMLQYDDVNRNIKINNKLSSITIYDKYENIKDMNYISFSKYRSANENIEVYFFFITDIISENDNMSKPSCTIRIKWDSWANNLDNMYYNNLDGTIKPSINNTNNIICRHYNRFNNKKPIFYNLDLPKFPILSTEAKFIDNQSTLGRYKPLYLALLIPNTDTDEVGFNAKERILYMTDYINIFSYLGQNIFYFPIAIYDTFNKKYVKGTITGTPSAYNGFDEDYRFETHEFNVYPMENSFVLDLKGRLMQYVKFAFLTFNCPLKYGVSLINDGVKITYPIPLFKIFNRYTKLVANSIDPNKMEWKTETDDLDINKEQKGYTFAIPTQMGGLFPVWWDEDKSNIDILEAFTQSGENPLKSIDWYNITNKSYDLTNEDCYIFSKDITETKEPILFNYPYNYDTLIFNNDKYDLVRFNNEYNFVYRIRIEYTNSEPLVFIDYINPLEDEDNVVFSSKGIVLKNSGQISFSTSSIDNYMINNGSQLENALILSKMEALTSAVLGKVTSIFGTNALAGVTAAVNAFISPRVTEIKQKSLLSDIENTPSVFSSNSFGENDKYYQDLILVSNNKIDFNSKDVINFLDLIYLNGFNYSSIGCVNENFRYWFDFVQTYNCILPNIPNLDDKKELETAFNRGIYKNHIHYLNNKFVIMEDLYKDKTRYNNIELDIALTEV